MFVYELFIALKFVDSSILTGTSADRVRCSFHEQPEWSGVKMEVNMLGWALTFFVLAIVAALT